MRSLTHRKLHTTKNYYREKSELDIWESGTEMNVHFYKILTRGISVS